MHRRKFIQNMALLSLMSPFIKLNASTNKKIVVVGAGIIGASIAYELSNLGIKTILIDKYKAGSGTSGSSFNWINATYPKKPYSYNYIAQLGVKAFKDIQNDLNYDIQWNGSLEWVNSKESQKELIDEVNKLMQYQTFTKHKIINHNKANILETNLNFRDNINIVHSVDDGVIDTNEFIKLLIDRINFNGSQVIEDCEYKNIKYTNNTISSIITSKGEIEANQIVFACGIDTNKIFNKKLLKSPEPGIIIKSKPHKKIINKIIYGPGIHLYQQKDGRVIIGEQGLLERNDIKKFSDYPSQFDSKLMENKYVNKIISIGKTFFNEIESLDIDQVKIGWRPIPLDEKPIIGRLNYDKNIYIATMHSGITLGPIVGKLVAKELTQNKELSILDGFRPGRFL